MTKLSWIKEFNGYKINLNFMCHYEKGFIKDFDSHNMTKIVDNTFIVMNNEFDRYKKMGFIG